MTPAQQAQLCALLHGATLADMSFADYQVLFLYLRERSLAPWLYGVLRERGGLASWPDGLQAELAAWWLANQARQQQMAVGGQRWLQALAAAHIPVISLKGACLAWDVYPHPAQRPMVDLDLLVPFADLDRAWAVGLSLGYQPQTPRYAHDSVKHQLPALGSPCGQFSVELHWRIGLADAPFPIPLAGVWAGVRAVPLAGQPAQGLGLEQQLLHLALNLAHQDQLSQPKTLLQLLDVSLCLQRYGTQLDWAVLQQYARAWRLERCLYLTLYLAQRIWHAPVPEFAMIGWQPAAWHPAWGERLTAEVLWGERWRHQHPLEPFVHDTLAPLARLPRYQRLPWLWRKLVLSRGELAKRYPAISYPVAQGWRWVRLPIQMVLRLALWARRRVTQAGQRHQQWVATSDALRAWLEAEAGGKE